MKWALAALNERRFCELLTVIDRRYSTGAFRC